MKKMLLYTLLILKETLVFTYGPLFFHQNLISDKRCCYKQYKTWTGNKSTCFSLKRLFQSFTPPPLKSMMRLITF